MNTIFIIGKREWRERVKSRSFITMALLGPLVVLFLLYILFTATGSDTKKIRILVSDPIEQLEKIIVTDEGQISYDFINAYVEPTEFVKQELFKDYDALLVVNEKVLSNNHVFFFQKEALNPKIPLRVQRELEKRLEGLKAREFTELTKEEFLIIKHPLSLEVRDAYRPEEKSNYKLAGYAGYVFGLFIYFFIFLFGMTVLRSTTREKSSRIAEVLLSIVRPRELMAGKLVGIGAAALVQFLIWGILITTGLYFIRLVLFPDLLDVNNLLVNEQFVRYNDIVVLVFEQLNFAIMIGFFLLLLILGYLFFGGLFAALGAAQGSESDGQQFLIPLLFLFFIGVWSGYFVLENPDSTLAYWLGILPFTSPMVIMVKLGIGYEANQMVQLYIGLFVLIVSLIVTIRLAGKFFQLALLKTDYRLTFRKLMSWVTKRAE
jgi:ABC-2 type transport system permease protein